jgi:hypothetical protein
MIIRSFFYVFNPLSEILQESESPLIKQSLRLEACKEIINDSALLFH